MRFASSVMAFIASAIAVSAANTVTFWTLDDQTRTIYFTGNPGTPDMEPVTVSNKEKTTVTFAEGYVGNFYAVQEGADNVPGMLGEVNFNSWDGLTYFDVSAIVNPLDHNNIKQMWPVDVQTPMSGCEVFPCDNAYWHPNDIQTKASEATNLMTTLGSGVTGLSF